MKKILVLVADYPDLTGGVSMMFVHTRNCYYTEHGINVTVLNFSTLESYYLDGIKVITLQDYQKDPAIYDTLVLHAANLRNHYFFLKKYQNRFKRLIFFYHGHEALRINKVYSKPYEYLKQNYLQKMCQDLYDTFKLCVWKYYLPKIAYKSRFVFVSHWMQDQFLSNTGLPGSFLDGKSFITYNSVSKEFEENTFDISAEKKYDFITIRSNLDNSKYAVDIVNWLAWNTPGKKFLLVGKGEFFQHNKKAPNLEWKNSCLNHEEIIQYLDRAKFALMPTRTDAQGLMMCEMAAYGIPVITSDIAVCHEIFGSFANVYYIDNEQTDFSLENFTESACLKHDAFYSNNTVYKEVMLINEK